MPRHSFTHKGKLTSKFHPFRSSEQSGQTQRRQDILRCNDAELAVIEGLFKRNYKGIRHAEMDHDFSLINGRRSHDFLETLLAKTDGKRSKKTALKDQDRQEANAGDSGTENTVYGDGPSAKKESYFRLSIRILMVIAVALLFKYPLRSYVPSLRRKFSNSAKELGFWSPMVELTLESSPELGLVISLVDAVSSTALTLVFPPLIELVACC